MSAAREPEREVDRDALDDYDDEAARHVLDYAILCTAFALAVAAFASEHVIGAWAAAWAYLIAIALTAWARSWLVVPLAIAATVLQLVRADAALPAIASAVAQLALAAIVVVVVRATRRNADRARELGDDADW